MKAFTHVVSAFSFAVSVGITANRAGARGGTVQEGKTGEQNDGNEYRQQQVEVIMICPDITLLAGSYTTGLNM